MKSNCEVCGHELGFFERSLKVEDTRLGLSYKTLCSACHRSISLAVDKVGAICSRMISELKGNLSKFRYAAGDINVLILLAVKEIFQLEPDFANPDGLLAATFFPDEQVSVRTKFDYLTHLTYKVLRHGFAPALGRYGLDAYDAFVGYMGRECYFIEQQRCNCGRDGQVVYADIFATPAGIVFFDTENNKVKTLFAGRDRTIGYSESEEGATYDLTIKKLRFKKVKEQPTIYFNRKDQRSGLAKRLTVYNDRKKERIDGELEALIKNLNVPIEKDLRKMHPEDNIRDIPLDSVIVSVIKTLFEQDIDQEYVKEAPDGLLSLIIERCYMDNFERSGFSEISEVNDYISDECLFVDGFEAAFNTQEFSEPAFAFLTPSAYMIKPISGKKAFLQGKVGLPNDLYCDYQYMIFQGQREFYITSSSSDKNEEGYYFLSGVRINARTKEPLEKLEKYFSRKALDYYENEFEKEYKKKDTLREKEIKDQTRRVFVGYGYLPFCIYDEWAQIEQTLRKSDLLMETLIEKREPKTGTKNAKIFYAGKTVNIFEQQASRLAESLGIRKLPVARGLLWNALKKEILEVCSNEFIRLAGDIVEPTDSIEDAFLRYSSLTSIQTEKAYYFGLFIYYLMSKGILEQTDFLDHYDRAAKVYIKLNPNHKQLEFSELSVPAHKPFDSESIDFKKFKPEVEEVPMEVDEGAGADSFIYSIRRDAEDLDTADELARSLNERLNPQTVTVPELELLSDLILDGTTLVYEESASLDDMEPQSLVMDNPDTEIFQGVEFVDLDSQTHEIVSQSVIEAMAEPEEEEEIYEEIITEVRPRKSATRRLGFDSVRTIVGMTRGKK